jgi:hypothetical protein
MTKPAGQRAIAGDSLRDVVTVTAWNALLDMLDQYRRSRPGAVIDSLPIDTQHCTIDVRNDTGATLYRWSTVGLSGVTVEPSVNADEFTERHVLKAVAIADIHATKFAVVQEDIPAGEIGTAVVCGVTIATVDVQATTDDYARPLVGSQRLESVDSGGIRILHVESAGDGQLALVLIGPPGEGADSKKTCCGCSPTECFDFSVWQTNAGDCPLFYSLLVDEDIECCNGLAGGEHILEYDEDSGYWIGPNIECGKQGSDCGTAEWEWSTSESCGSKTYQWNSECGGCWYEWNPATPPFCVNGSWSLISSSCGSCGPCEAPDHPGYGCDSGPDIQMPCTFITGSWVLWAGSCLCGTAPAPTEPGEFPGDFATVPCTGATGFWTTTSDDCTCGDAVAPETDGEFDGEVRVTSCVDPGAAPNCGSAEWTYYDCPGTVYTSQFVQSAETGAFQLVWVQTSADCSGTPSCGTAHSGGPGGTPVLEGQTVTVECEKHGWELTTDDCTCGDPVPPNAALFAQHGDTKTTSCAEPIYAFWRYVPAVGYTPAEVQFVVDGAIKIRYRLPYNRSFCCKCQSRWDILVDSPCSWPCNGAPQSVCMVPKKENPSGGTCTNYANSYSLTVDRLDMWPGPSPLRSTDPCQAAAGINDPGAPNNIVVGTFTLSLFVVLTEELDGGKCWYLDEDWCYQTPTGCQRPSLSDGWIKSPWSMKIPAAGSPKLLVTPRQYWDSAGDPHGPNTADADAEYDLDETLDDGSLVMRFASGGGPEDCYWPEYLLLIPNA